MDVLRLVEYDLKQIIQSHGLRKVMLVFKEHKDVQDLKVFKAQQVFKVM